ncbi:unnamed protein product [Leptidea sinapis]|uniref:Uncharacterized protein n=1 Tax=Leptidea sinapis TaxID=189913 RepID=A0A5E4QV74_9NEOP|nr:unnamed protein product [Leptidea sinapis]
MPKTAYERIEKKNESTSLVSSPTISLADPDLDAEKLKDFYRSIPDYSDINHLPENEFYTTLKLLREKKKAVLGMAIGGETFKETNDLVQHKEDDIENKIKLLQLRSPSKVRNSSALSSNKNTRTQMPTLRNGKKVVRNTSSIIETNNEVSRAKTINSALSVTGNSKLDRPKRNHSACSITWQDNKDLRNELDDKFAKFFENRNCSSNVNDDIEFRTRSMPSSPLRSRRTSLSTKRRGITVPKPFKMTERDEEDRIVNELRSIQKSFSEDMLDRKCKRKGFRANPVPIESRILLYDKIMEDQAMRSMNRRIRAEEMLRNAITPGTMTSRERSRLSTPGAHSDLPVDPSPAAPSVTSSDYLRSNSPTKTLRKNKTFITTSPQPFRLNTADRADKKMKDIVRKINSDSKCSISSNSNQDNCGSSKAYSALELKGVESGRSNLAAILRAEAVRRRFDLEAAQSMAEQRRRNEMKYRGRLLRSNPAWYLVKNNNSNIHFSHEEDIAMRLQTRRDEERLRREEYMHEMELMYGRVQQQPMLFERLYAPRPPNTPIDFLQLSPRKTTKKKHCSKKPKQSHFTSPSVSDFQDEHLRDVNVYFDKMD